MVNQQEVLEHVGRLLDSEQFVGSRSVAKLLTFCVDTALAGNEDSLKETTIGIFCFGRTPGYDTKQDPIVRVTAGRLRKKLELFYQGAGEHCRLRILFPKGTYVPRFNRSSDQPPAVEPASEENPEFFDHALFDHAPAVDAKSLVSDKIPVKPPRALIAESNWLQPAMWGFLAFLLMASCGVFLTYTGPFEDTKPVTSHDHPSHLASLPSDHTSIASGTPGKVTELHERLSSDQVASSTEDMASVEPRL